ncbi:MAG: nucleotidyltransferase family protein, partial [Verrucomicrobium sp.]
DSQSHEPSIVASSYSGQLGVPAWFSSILFSKLLALQGEKGARSLIMTERNVFHLDAPDAAYDIDTPADLLTK